MLKKLTIAIGLVLTTAPIVANAHDWVISTNDAKYQRVKDTDTFSQSGPGDSVDIFDASVNPLKLLHRVPVAATIAGPPQAAAISSDGKLAIVSAPNHYDAEQKKPVYDNYLQVIDLSSEQPKVIAKVETLAHPQGVALSKDGKLLLVATVAGTLEAYSIDGTQLTRTANLILSKGRLASVAITPDGKSALVSLRNEGGLVTLNIDNGHVTNSKERVSSGLAPYSIDVSADGKWAIVGNVGGSGLPGTPGILAGDADSITLIDISKRPFRAVQFITTKALPEGIAISPNGEWIAAQTMDGSQLTPDNPGVHTNGKLQLFKLSNGQAHFVNELDSGTAGQGLVFAKDNKTLIAQFNVEKQLAIFQIQSGKLVDTKERIDVPGGPSSLRTMPR
ncbi:YncE family protein [Carnimonas nigrificans]|uniref:YncE family protein n=1 Tax=Carnimonas nigrificans TaxID=64323 RepID=UPI0004705C16|nr:beta-propeller fold lactonase family protein [Carnimonas nigrificans]